MPATGIYDIATGIMDRATIPHPRDVAERVAAGRRWLARHWADPLYRQSYLMLASTGVSAVTGLLFWVVAARRPSPPCSARPPVCSPANSFLSYLTGFGLPYAMLRFGGSDRSRRG
jgi:hypothetical protein